MTLLVVALSKDSTTRESATVWLTDEGDRIPGHVSCRINGKDIHAGLVAKLGYANPVASTSVPTNILLSTTTQCNLNCIHCISAFSRKSLKRLDDRILEELDSHAKIGHIKSISTDYSGDVLWSDYRFGGDIDYILKLDTPFNIDTNGVYLTRENAARLTASKLKALNVSLDAGQDHTFKRIRKGAPDLETIIQNMQNFTVVRAETGRFDICTSISFTIMNSNIHEIFDVINLSRRTGFQTVYANHIEIYDSALEQESMWFHKEKFNDIREKAIQFARLNDVDLRVPPAFSDLPERRGHTMCDEPWTSAMILGNGDVRVCCIPDETLIMGNLNDQPLDHIWNGDKYQEFRKSINSKHPPRSCEACPRHRLTGNSLSYLLYKSIQ